MHHLLEEIHKRHGRNIRHMKLPQYRESEVHDAAFMRRLFEKACWDRGKLLAMIYGKQAVKDGSNG